MQGDVSPELGQPEEPANMDAIESGPQEPVAPAANRDRQDTILRLGRFIPGTVVSLPRPSMHTRPYVQQHHGTQH